MNWSTVKLTLLTLHAQPGESQLLDVTGMKTTEEAEKTTTSHAID